MRYGTSHFTSRTRAEIYYRKQGYENAADAVRVKLHNDEIHIGAPTLKPGETCQPDQDGRYIITTFKEATK